jgi:hypothetical protein
MISTKLASIGLAAALVAGLSAVSAQAQAPRTFVSAAGTDNSTCSFAAPCRHFQAAVNATSAGGEVDALDPAGYGPIVISQAITIEGQGWSYAAPAANSPAITINAVSGNVFIHGVSLNGVGITGGTNGIVFNSGGTLTVSDSVIRNFTGSGIVFQPNSSTLSQIYVSNTLLSDNGVNGININPTASGTTKGVLDHVKMQNNAQFGLNIFSATQSVTVTINDSVSANSTLTGINANSSGTTQVNVMVRNSTIANNALNGLQAVDGGAVVRVTRSTITGNGAGWNNVGGGTVVSYGDNNIDGNEVVNTEPPNPLVYH